MSTYHINGNLGDNRVENLLLVDPPTNNARIEAKTLDNMTKVSKEQIQQRVKVARADKVD